MSLFIRSLFFYSFLFVSTGHLYAQNATIFGTVTDSLNNVIPYVNIIIKDTDKGIATDIRGNYELSIPANIAVQIIFSHSEYISKEYTINVANGERRELNVMLSVNTITLEGVDITEQIEREREEAGTLTIDPKTLQAIPTPFGDFNQALISGGGLGISGNNELSASYSVRGGNFDENIVFVNGIQIYRPFLIRAGEQEGLSFVNTDLVESVSFSSGGWQPKYGDKLSSVLNVNYKKPEKFGASLTASLLGGSLSAEGASKNGKIRFVTGLRHKSSRYLLNTLETDGQYLPRFTDWQNFVTFDLSGKNKPQGTTELSVLTSYARNRYELLPQSRVTNFGTFGRAFRLSVLFVGSEELSYDTFQGGLKFSHRFNEKLSTELYFSYMQTREREFINVEGGYQLCDVNSNFSSDNFNECVLVRGFGSEFRYGRNLLDANATAIESRNIFRPWEHTQLEAGIRIAGEEIEDELYEYNFLDSADFVQLDELIVSSNNLGSTRIAAYLQARHQIGLSHTITYGGRISYWNVNNQLVFNPRLQYAFSPVWDRDIIFKAAVGLYAQPPFYRELRNFQGNVNRNLRAQQSLHAIVGIDWNIRLWGRPFKFISEAYYKNLWDVVPYDIDNVRLRYYANNDAVAYVYGADFRLSGEFIKGTESWISISYLQAREDVPNDGRGFIRRPSDQRITFNLFFEDHLPNDPSIRVYLRAIFGSGLPYGPPNSPEFRAALSSGSDYIRSDIGFSKIFRPKRNKDKRKLESIWVGLEVLNLFGAENNISFNWVPDFGGNEFAIPNSLSQRFFNLKMVIRY